MERCLKIRPQKCELFSILLDLLFPTRCPGCDQVICYKERKRGFCNDCIKEIKYAGNDICMKCGHPLLDKNKEYCNECGKRKRAFDRGLGVYVYRGPMKNAMYRFKYSNRRCYGKIFARDAVKIYGRWIKDKGIDVIIPVPMYKKKQRRRGYNQAEVMARELSEKMGIFMDADSISRIKDTVPMKNLSGEERRYNLENAFKFSEKGVKFKKVLLVDDIYTTGSTMEAVASILKKAGVENVYCLSICIGDAY